MSTTFDPSTRLFASKKLTCVATKIRHVRKLRKFSIQEPKKTTPHTHLYWLESAARCGFWESLQKHSQARLTCYCVRKQRNTTPFSALKISIKLSRVTIHFDFWLTYIHNRTNFLPGSLNCTRMSRNGHWTQFVFFGGVWIPGGAYCECVSKGPTN
jgi:hypothetical protein